MRQVGVPAILTADPINIVYGCGVRNMTVFGMMGPSRFLLLFADGPSILFEFAGSEHLADGVPTVDEVRIAGGITPNSGPRYVASATSFANELAAEVHRQVGRHATLAVERVDFGFTDLLRSNGLTLADATGIFLEARRLKQPSELTIMREAIRRVEGAVRCMEQAIEPGSTELAIWAAFHHELIVTDGEYVSTRLLQSGPNTFPYFQEAQDRRLRAGDLLCFDSDALGLGGYAVDLSRTFLCGTDEPSERQRILYRRAHEQLQHNSALLGPGRSYQDLASRAWVVPDEHRPFGYYCLMHGLGLSGEHPYVPLHRDGEPYDFEGEFEPNMVVCVESYIGDPASKQGVKLEDQFLITETGAERLTTYPFDDRLLVS